MFNQTQLRNFWSKVLFTTDCWEWQNGKNKRGYGVFGIERKIRLSHRISYQFYFGEIPEGFELDHLCRNKKCINPYHLEAVTHKENIRRGDAGLYNRNKTHCKYGHEFNEENIYKINNERICKICRNKNQTKYRLKKRGCIEK